MDDDPRIGTELGGYRIESVLGRGGMSVVYVAEQQRPKRKVALKLLAPDLAEDARFRDRFLRESNSAAAIDHPNIIPIYGTGEEGGVLYIAMRYVRGTDLKRVIERDGALPVERTEAILAQVADALDAAHAEGLVHRDVKPGNILIAPREGSKPEHVYLADFGLTKRTSSDSGLTGTGQFIGTLDYAAPEQIEGKPLDGRTDQYSLGCVAFECLTGQVPFPRDVEMAVMWAHVQQPPPKVTERRSAMPAGMDAVVARAMAKDPANRFPTCSEFVGALASPPDPAAGGGTSAPSPAKGRAEMAPLPNRIGRRTIAVAAAIATAAIVGLVAVRVLGARPHVTVPPHPIVADAAVKIDVATHRLVARVGVSSSFGNPKDVAVGEGAVWVTTWTGPVYRIDAGGARVTGRLTSFTAQSAATGEHSLWLGSKVLQTGRVDRLDAATGDRIADVDLGARTSPISIAVGFGSAWVVEAATGRLVRIDARSNHVAARIPIGTEPLHVAVGEGSVWVTEGVSATVVRIDPKTNRIVDRIHLSGSVNGVAVGAGGVWVTDDAQGTVTHIDAATDQIEATIPVGPGASGVAVGGGFAWVANSDAGTVSQVDLVLNQTVRTIDVGSRPSGIAFDVQDDAIWVTESGRGNA